MPILNHKDRDRGPEDWQNIRAQIRDHYEWRCECIGESGRCHEGRQAGGRDPDGHPVGAHPNLHDLAVLGRMT